MSCQNNLSNLPEHIRHDILEFLVPDPRARPTSLPAEKKFGVVQQAEDVYKSKFTSQRDALLALSKTNKFWRRLSLPYLYRNVHFTGSQQGASCIRSFLETLLQHPERGPWVCKLSWELPDPRADGTSELTRLRRCPGRGETCPRAVQLLKHMYANSSLGYPLAAVAFPILALTTRLKELTILEGFRWYRILRFPRVADPFLSFIRGQPTPEYQALLAEYFPSSEFQPKLSGAGQVVAFPPPELAVISCFDTLDLQHHVQKSMVLNAKFYVHPMRSQLQLCAIFRDLKDQLDSNCNGQATTAAGPAVFRPSSILRASAESYLHICSALDRARKLALDFSGSRISWRLHLDWLKGLPGDETERKSSLADLDRLDERNQYFDKAIDPFPQKIPARLLMFGRLCTEYPLVWFINYMRQDGSFFMTRSWLKLRHLSLVHPHNTTLGPDASPRPGDTYKGFGSYLRDGTAPVTHLDLPLRPVIHDRPWIYGSLDPSELTWVTRLEITVEGLWGPMTTTMRMLEEHEECTCQLDRWGKCLEHVTLEELRAMRRKAIARLPPGIVKLRLLDWFVEYYGGQHEGINSEASHEQVGEEEGEEDEDKGYFIDEDGTLFDPHAGHSTYYYPELLYTYPGGEEGELPNNHLGTLTRVELARRYIRALEHGLVQLFVTPQPRTTELPVSLRTELRPSLRRIEFVYTLLRHEETTKRDESAWLADNEWRSWCASPRCQSLVKTLGDEGIKFVVSEAEEGNTPRAPVSDYEVRRMLRSARDNDDTTNSE